MACHESRLQVNVRLAYHRLGRASLCLVKAGSAHDQDLASVLHRNGLLSQLSNDRIDYFISREKKADVLFKDGDVLPELQIFQFQLPDPLLLGRERFADARLAALLGAVPVHVKIVVA